MIIIEKLQKKSYLLNLHRKVSIKVSIKKLSKLVSKRSRYIPKSNSNRVIVNSKQGGNKHNLYEMRAEAFFGFSAE
jgi:hypothetical protein